MSCVQSEQCPHPSSCTCTFHFHSFKEGPSFPPCSQNTAAHGSSFRASVWIAPPDPHSLLSTLLAAPGGECHGLAGSLLPQYCTLWFSPLQTLPFVKSLFKKLKAPQIPSLNLTSASCQDLDGYLALLLFTSRLYLLL